MPLFNASTLARLLFSMLFVATVPALATEPAQANALKDISRLINQNQNDQALDRVNSYLSDHPKDMQGQFLKGVILADQNKPAEAIKIFTDLTEKHPELPEPYNNLAVLYADQGQYDKARRSLEMAIKTHPSYSTAHENLGDIYAKMASDAYDKALQLDKVNARAQTKLSMIKDLFSSGAPKPPATKPQEPIKSVVTPVVVAEAAKPAPPAPATTPAAPKEPVKDQVKTADKPAITPKEEPKSEPSVREDGKDAVLGAVRNWAKAWSAKNMDAYLDSYATSFKTPNGESRKAWEQSRRERIRKPEQIKVEVLSPKIKIDGNHATVVFNQVYRAGGDTKRTPKTLVMKKTGTKWLIEQELTKR